MKYNTQEKKLILPEYGRNVQSMVDFAMTIDDRAERTRCANSIIQIMGNLFPHLRDVEEFNHKLWDHLAIMSDFKLDIDYPYEIIKKDNLYTRPDKIKYVKPKIRYRHYGKIRQNMIEKTMVLFKRRKKRKCMGKTNSKAVNEFAKRSKTPWLRSMIVSMFVAETPMWFLYMVLGAFTNNQIAYIKDGCG